MKRTTHPDRKRIDVAMNAFLLLRGTAAALTLIAGVFAAVVRFGPVVAPERHEQAMIALAAAIGQDIGPVAPAETNIRNAAY